MQGCIFCKIVKGEIPTDFISESDNFVLFNDIKPSAPVHVLVVTKKHFNDVREMSDELWSEAKSLALEHAKINDLKGFRLGNNVGEAAFIPHFHLHLLGGIKADRSI